MPYVREAFSILLILITQAGCRPGHVHSTKTAFYYWKTVYAPTRFEKATMQQLNSQKVFLRFFDVGWDITKGDALPQAIVKIPVHQNPLNEFVPVVFITQQTITSIHGENAQGIAVKIAQLLKSLCINSNLKPKEIQIDCDWTSASRGTYFLLLRKLRSQEFFKDKLLSCTIRLHQVKYKLKSGIPPVDRGMLMCYNVGDLKQPAAHNSILDVALTKNYLNNLEAYPLPLDVALPLFRWCVLFRKGVFAGIIRDADPDELDNSFFRKETPTFYSVPADSIWHGYALKAGDMIRAESSSVNDLKELARFTAQRLHNDSATITFFHSDSLTLSHYTTDELKAILAAYH